MHGFGDGVGQHGGHFDWRDGRLGLELIWKGDRERYGRIRSQDLLSTEHANSKNAFETMPYHTNIVILCHDRLEKCNESLPQEDGGKDSL